MKSKKNKNVGLNRLETVRSLTIKLIIFSGILLMVYKMPGKLSVIRQLKNYLGLICSLLPKKVLCILQLNQ